MSGGILILVILSLNQQDKVGCANLYDLLSYEECVDEKLFNQYSFQLINSRITSIESPIYKQWKNKQISFDQYISSTTSFIRGWSESNLEQTLINNRRKHKDICELLNRFWNLYEEKVREKPNLAHFSEDYVYVNLKKK
ncbi:hypothetical protein I4U23_005947 [Adineta vaga]|nr:hypothetical protein I4U23_005947 [Adineta vaga]